MVDFVGVNETKGWFQESGKDNDVVIASRTRLARNLSGHKFPLVMKAEEEQEIQSDILSAFGTIGDRHTFNSALLGDISPIERRMLMERNYISQKFSMQTHRAFVLRADQRVSAMINEVDHLRVAALSGGLSLERCWGEADAVDTALERSLDMAVSLEWGYLTSDVTNAGTGMRASAMVHVPGLVATGVIDKAIKAVVQAGMTVKGFFGNGEGSLGEMYQISNQLTLGVSESEIIEKLDGIVVQLVHYERKAREELLHQERVETQDKILRSFGILKYCRKLTAKEAIGHLSALRLGASMGIIDVPLETISALLVLTQKAHVQHSLAADGRDADNGAVDCKRAELVRSALLHREANWEDLDV